MKGLLLWMVLPLALCAQPKAVVPANGPAPAGPYTPGVIGDGYLYVSGQGARKPGADIPSTPEAQIAQTLENVKTIVEAAGLTMDHVVYTHVYLEDVSQTPVLDRAFARYFPKAPPARALIGVARLPGTPVEINAVAVVDKKGRKPVTIAGADPNLAYSPGILTHDRLFVSSMPPRSKGAIPTDPAEQVNAALDAMSAVAEAAGLSMKHMVMVRPYLTKQMPARVMNENYAKRFEFGNTPARATIQVNALPEGNIVFTGVAVRDLAKRKAVRPKNMAPSATASPCVFAGDTLYCSAKSGFIPGPNSGIYAATVEHQLRQTMRNLLDNLEEAEMDFRSVVSTNVFLDNVDDFQAMNKVYAQYFQGVKPARTTLQQAPAGPREPDPNGRFPTLEQISLIAVRSGAY